MIQITSIHLVGSEEHQNIQSVTWLNPNTNERGSTNKQGLIDWLRKGGTATINKDGKTLNVQIVEGGSPYFRAFDGDTATDDLLALPRY